MENQECRFSGGLKIVAGLSSIGESCAARLPVECSSDAFVIPPATMPFRGHLAAVRRAPSPDGRAPGDGRVVAIPQVGGLQHRYERQAA